MATGPHAGTLANQQFLSTEKETRIAIIDDHAIVREGLARLIRHEMELVVCGLFEGSQHVLNSVTAFQADMVIVEIALNGIDGIGLIKSIRMRFPQVPILVLSLQEECLYAERAFRAGANGYIMKRETPLQLMSAVNSVLKGNLFLSQKMSALVLTEYLNGRTRGAALPQISLSNRELEIFQLIGAGTSHTNDSRIITLEYQDCGDPSGSHYEKAEPQELNSATATGDAMDRVRTITSRSSDLLASGGLHKKVRLS